MNNFTVYGARSGYVSSHKTKLGAIRAIFRRRVTDSYTVVQWEDVQNVGCPSYLKKHIVFKFSK